MFIEYCSNVNFLQGSKGNLELRNKLVFHKVKLCVLILAWYLLAGEQWTRTKDKEIYSWKKKNNNRRSVFITAWHTNAQSTWSRKRKHLRIAPSRRLLQTQLKSSVEIVSSLQRYKESYEFIISNCDDKKAALTNCKVKGEKLEVNESLLIHVHFTLTNVSRKIAFPAFQEVLSRFSFVSRIFFSEGKTGS